MYLFAQRLGSPQRSSRGSTIRILLRLVNCEIPTPQNSFLSNRTATDGPNFLRTTYLRSLERDLRRLIGLEQPKRVKQNARFEIREERDC